MAAITLKSLAATHWSPKDEKFVGPEVPETVMNFIRILIYIIINKIQYIKIYILIKNLIYIYINYRLKLLFVKNF